MNPTSTSKTGSFSSCQSLSQSLGYTSQSCYTSQSFDFTSLSQALSSSNDSLPEFSENDRFIFEKSLDSSQEKTNETFKRKKKERSANQSSPKTIFGSTKDVFKRKNKEKFSNISLSLSLSPSENFGEEIKVSTNKPLSSSTELKRKMEQQETKDKYKKLRINIPGNNNNNNAEYALDTSFDPRNKIQIPDFIHPSTDKSYRNYTIAASKKNELLNRYNNNYPDDENIYTPRNYFLLGKDIKLAPYYVNASKISFDFDGKSVLYIATQAPLENQTFNEFWKMIVAGKSKVLVNLAMVLENNKIKSDDYWSNEYWKKALDEEDSDNYYSDHSLELISETPQVDIACSKDRRQFKVYDGDQAMGHITKAKQKDDNGQEVDDIIIACSKSNEKERIVQRLFEFTPYDEDPKTQQFIQFHYENWPDNGIPSDIGLLETLIDKIIAKDIENESMLQISEQGPDVFHCSAGLGRTGTVIAILAIIKQLEMQIQNKCPLNIDPVKIVDRMRECRKGMVQSKEQFELIYTIVQRYVKKQIKLGRIEPKKLIEIKV